MVVVLQAVVCLRRRGVGLKLGEGAAGGDALVDRCGQGSGLGTRRSLLGDGSIHLGLQRCTSMHLDAGTRLCDNVACEASHILD